jgi:stage III sporulation protein SpoIIIAA
LIKFLKQSKSFLHLEKQKMRFSSLLRLRALTRVPLLPLNESTSQFRPSPSQLSLPSSGVVENISSSNVRLAPTVQEAWAAIDQLFRSANTGTSTATAVHEENERNSDLTILANVTSQMELHHLLTVLPKAIRDRIVSHPTFQEDSLEELFFHLGQEVESRGATWMFSIPPPTHEDLSFVLKRVGGFGSDGRANIPGTLHRVSCWRGRRGEILGVTMRVGRYIPHVARALLPVLSRGNVLLLSKPGVGKTTILRDLTATLARMPTSPRVVVVDTSNEICGDSIIPLPFIGRARRFQVPKRSDNLRIMLEVLQNHTPEYMIIDEISTTQEAEAAWSISQRGVRMIATCHGEGLSALLQNRDLNLLVGGVQQAFLSNEERRLRKKIKKTILERPYSSPFETVIELTSRGKALIYKNVNDAVDTALNEEDPKKFIHLCGQIDLSESLPAAFFDAPKSGDVKNNTELQESLEALQAEAQYQPQYRNEDQRHNIQLKKGNYQQQQQQPYNNRKRHYRNNDGYIDNEFL